MTDLFDNMIEYNSKYIKFESNKEYILVISKPTSKEINTNEGKKLAFKADVLECNGIKYEVPKLLVMTGSRFLHAIKAAYPNGLEDNIKVSITKKGNSFQTQWIINRIFF